MKVRNPKTRLIVAASETIPTCSTSLSFRAKSRNLSLKENCQNLE